MTCDEVRANLALYLYSELSFEQEEAVEQHLDGCQECREELERERGLQRVMDVAACEPSVELLVSCRRELDQRMAVEVAKPPLWTRFGRWAMTVRPLLRPMGAVALLAAGFFGARLWDASQSSARPSWTRIRSLSADPRGELQLVVEEVRQRSVRGRLEDEDVRQMLIAAASDPADAGLRLQTLEILKNSGYSADVRRALLRAVERDANDGVRMKAIEGLRAFTSDPETRRVLSSVVLEDENTVVRTQAIELLLEQPQFDSIGTLQELIMRENNPYIRHKTLKALKAMNASAETF